MLPLQPSCLDGDRLPGSQRPNPDFIGGIDRAARRRRQRVFSLLIFGGSIGTTFATGFPAW
jgi:hypothetical protein